MDKVRDPCPKSYLCCFTPWVSKFGTCDIIQKFHHAHILYYILRFYMRLLLKIMEGGMSAIRFNTFFWKIAATITFTARE